LGDGKLNCSICGGRASLVWAGHPGYVAPTTYDIYSCEICEASHARPLELDPNLYTLIYRQPKSLLGYSSMAEFADGIGRQKDPLGWLGSRHAIFYPVAELLRDPVPGAKVADLGSGLGYMTYALRSAGWDAIGVDVAPNAVAAASERFGPHFHTADIPSFAREQPASFDVVIVAELIEHVVDPVQTMRDVGAMLKPGGRAFVTTPNKTFFRAGTIWEGDVPPAHLWWLSETSLRFIARETGLSLTFFDYSALNRKNLIRSPATYTTHPTEGHRLDANGNSIWKGEPSWLAASLAPLRRFDLTYRLRGLAARAVAPLRALSEVAGVASADAFSRRPTMCGIFTKTAGE